MSASRSQPDDPEVSLVLRDDWDMWQLVSREFMSQLPTLDLSLKRGRSAVTVKLSPWPKTEGQLHAPAARAHEEALNGIIKPTTPSHTVVSNSMFNTSVPASASILETSDLDLYTKPCVTMFVIKCEDPDRYPTEVRPLLMRFLETIVRAHRQQSLSDFLILYLPLGDRNPAPLMFPARAYRTVFSLIQYDIASVCPDDSLSELHPRLHRIDLSKTTSAVAASLGLPSSNSSLLSGSASIAAPKSSAENSPLSAFFVALKTRLATVLDSRLVYLEDKLRALDATRNSNSFDFNRFFLLKEGVALAYQQLQMKEEAMRHYSELEVVADSVQTSIGQIGNATSFRLPEIFDCSFRDFRQRLLHSVSENSSAVQVNKSTQATIELEPASVPEFYQYLFARQCKLYTQLHKPLEILSRGLMFLKFFVPLMLSLTRSAFRSQHNTLESPEKFSAESNSNNEISRIVFIRCWAVRAYIELTSVSQRLIDQNAPALHRLSSSGNIRNPLSPTPATPAQPPVKISDQKLIEYRGMQGELLANALDQVIALGQLVSPQLFAFYKCPTSDATKSWFDETATQFLVEKLAVSGTESSSDSNSDGFNAAQFWTFVKEWLQSCQLNQTEPVTPTSRGGSANMMSPSLSRQYRHWISGGLDAANIDKNADFSQNLRLDRRNSIKQHQSKTPKQTTDVGLKAAILSPEQRHAIASRERALSSVSPLSQQQLTPISNHSSDFNFDSPPASNWAQAATKWLQASFTSPKVRSTSAPPPVTQPDILSSPSAINSVSIIMNGLLASSPLLSSATAFNEFESVILACIDSSQPASDRGDVQTLLQMVAALSLAAEQIFMHAKKDRFACRMRHYRLVVLMRLEKFAEAMELALQNLQIFEQELWDSLFLQTQLLLLNCYRRLYLWSDYVNTIVFLLARLGSNETETSSKLQNELNDFLQSSWCQPSSQMLMHPAMAQRISLNVVEFPRFPVEIQSMFQSVLLEQPLVCPLDQFFDLQHISAIGCNESNADSNLCIGDDIQVTLAFHSRLPNAFRVDRLSLLFTLESSDDSDDVPAWSCQAENVDVVTGSNTIHLTGRLTLTSQSEKPLNLPAQRMNHHFQCGSCMSELVSLASNTCAPRIMNLAALTAHSSALCFHTMFAENSTRAAEVFKPLEIGYCRVPAFQVQLVHSDPNTNALPLSALIPHQFSVDVASMDSFSNICIETLELQCDNSGFSLRRLSYQPLTVDLPACLSYEISALPTKDMGLQSCLLNLTVCFADSRSGLRFCLPFGLNLPFLWPLLQQVSVKQVHSEYYLLLVSLRSFVFSNQISNLRLCTSGFIISESYLGNSQLDSQVALSNNGVEISCNSLLVPNATQTLAFRIQPDHSASRFGVEIFVDCKILTMLDHPIEKYVVESDEEWNKPFSLSTQDNVATLTWQNLLGSPFNSKLHICLRFPQFECQHQVQISVGTTLHLNVQVVNLPAGPWFIDIESDFRVWVLQGKQRMALNGTGSYTVQLIPLVSGSHAIPKFYVSQNNVSFSADQILFECNFDEVVVTK